MALYKYACEYACIEIHACAWYKNVCKHVHKHINMHSTKMYTVQNHVYMYEHIVYVYVNTYMHMHRYICT